MIYDQIDNTDTPELAELKARLNEVDTLIAAKTVEANGEDSKSREATLREEIKQLRKEQRQLWGTIEGIKNRAFQILLSQEYDLPLTHPKFDKTFALAWEHGHSSGFSDVENYFREFAELAR